MGNVISDFFRPKTVPGVHSVYVLTALGKDKADSYAANTPWAEVLSYLNEHNSASVSEISRELKMNQQKVKLIVSNMMKSGYVRKANTDGI